jgi:hypothetical protein
MTHSSKKTTEIYLEGGEAALKDGDCVRVTRRSGPARCWCPARKNVKPEFYANFTRGFLGSVQSRI